MAIDNSIYHPWKCKEKVYKQITVVSFEFLSLFFFFYIKILFYSWKTQRERQRHREREKQAPCREPNVGLNPRIPGSHPELKADTQPLSHPGVLPWAILSLACLSSCVYDKAQFRCMVFNIILSNFLLVTVTSTSSVQFLDFSLIIKKSTSNHIFTLKRKTSSISILYFQGTPYFLKWFGGASGWLCQKSMPFLILG